MSLLRRLRSPRSVCPALLTALALAGCGGATAANALGPSAGDGIDGGTLANDAPGADARAEDGAPPSASKGSSPIDPPGIYLTSDGATGSGACASTSLGAVLTAIRAADPTLADIRTLYNPATATTDGSFIYAYDVGAHGFAVVFKRGLGDCLAGCTENDYQYFSTDASCQPMNVGHYHAGWGSGTCLTVDGVPMWSHPTPPDPLTVCGADNSARDLRGTYGVSATGQHTPCATGESASPIGRVVDLLVEQDPLDLGVGFVTFSATGDPLVDGVRMPAHFQRSRFDAALTSSLPPGSCPNASSITARFDFEGYQPGGIDALDFGDGVCASCKSALSVVLGDAARLP